MGATAGLADRYRPSILVQIPGIAFRRPLARLLGISIFTFDFSPWDVGDIAADAIERATNPRDKKNPRMLISRHTFDQILVLDQ